MGTEEDPKEMLRKIQDRSVEGIVRKSGIPSEFVEIVIRIARQLERIRAWGSPVRNTTRRNSIDRESVVTLMWIDGEFFAHTPAILWWRVKLLFEVACDGKVKRQIDWIVEVDTENVVQCVRVVPSMHNDKAAFHGSSARLFLAQRKR